MSGNHDQTDNLDAKFKLGFVLNSGFMIFEFIIGFSIGSLALISDAAHNLTDSTTLVISFLANRIGKRKADDKRTYGYGRATIMAALLNSSVLVAIAGYIFFEAYQRFRHPSPVGGRYVMLVAGVGILVNTGVALLFRSNRDDLNVRSAYLNMAFDAVASVGALLAGLLIILTGQTWIDPLVGVLIGLMLLYGARSVLSSALRVLLEGVPEGIIIGEVKQAITDFKDVTGVDDLHIWAISSNQAALSCHLVVDTKDLTASLKIVSGVKKLLRNKFHIDHATIEIQLESCLPHDN